MKTRTAASLMNASFKAARPATLDGEIKGFSLDSRSIAPGELFFALLQEDYTRAGFNGTFADSHEFINEALQRGAIAAVARRSRVEGDAQLDKLRDRLLLVDDVIAALQTLAHKVYEAWGHPVVGITGSAGKTTTKDLTAHVLDAAGRRVLKSARNYNNGLGLPLSVLQMVSDGNTPDAYDVAVLEMGMSSRGEIARLCKITPPSVGVELLVAPVHLEYLGSLDAIAAEKADLVANMKPDGVAVLNADDARVLAMRSRHDGRSLTFGIENEADITAVDIDATRFGEIRFRLRTPLGDAPAMLPMPGRHNLMNALAAAAVATVFEIETETIARAFATAAAPHMRGEVLDFAAGFTVVDDSYNSNPRSLVSMVQTIAESGAERKRRLIVAGEMLELGHESAQMHRDAGRAIAASGVDVLWGVRGMAREIIEGARREGMTNAAIKFFESAEDAAAALAPELRAGDLVLVKGSRGVRMDKVVEYLRERFPLNNADESG
ncbi:MAG: UDP-N-acetylmuramoyl-tripeptide--D-alanyl-D-alanine ligase [Pyrinomonadaceae bacterium]